MGIESVVSQDNGLGILEFCEDLGFKGKVALDGVALGCRERRTVRNGFAGQQG